MANPNLIIELQKSMNKLIDDERSSTNSLFCLLKSAELISTKALEPVPNDKLPKELQDILSAFLSQDSFTSSTNALLQKVAPTVLLEDLITANNLVQLYFQVTQPLDQILSNLIDNLNPSLLTKSINNPVTLINIEESIKIINQDRKNLQKDQNKILREFESDIDEQKLQDLLQRSSDILAELQGFTPTSANLEQLLLDTGDFVTHLQKAQELFKTFSRQGEAIRDSEAGEVEQLIRNWRDTIKATEGLELNEDIRDQLNKDSEKSRQAIAQSIQIHELLEANYSFLSDLIRSGDLVSPGIL